MQRYNIFSSCHDTTNDNKHLEIMSQWHPQMHNLNQNFFLQKYLNNAESATCAEKTTKFVKQASCKLQYLKMLND